MQLERCWAKGAWPAGWLLLSKTFVTSSAQLVDEVWWATLAGWLLYLVMLAPYFIYGLDCSFYGFSWTHTHIHTHIERHRYMLYAWLLAYARNGSQHAENSVISFIFGRSVYASLVGYWKIWAKYEMLLKRKFYKISVGWRLSHWCKEHSICCDLSNWPQKSIAWVLAPARLRVGG